MQYNKAKSMPLATKHHNLSAENSKIFIGFFYFRLRPFEQFQTLSLLFIS
jgi:hypothetical protein